MATMLMYRTIAKKVFGEFDSKIMENLSNVLPLSPTWLSHHTSERLGLLFKEDYPLDKSPFIGWLNRFWKY